MPSVRATSLCRNLPRPFSLYRFRYYIKPTGHHYTHLLCSGAHRLQQLSFLLHSICIRLSHMRTHQLQKNISSFAAIAHFSHSSRPSPTWVAFSLESIDMGDLQLTTLCSDMVWREIRSDALLMSREENELFLDTGVASGLLSGILQSSVLQWQSLEEALADIVACKLSSEFAPKKRWHAILRTSFTEGLAQSGKSIRSLIVDDLIAIKDRDPACPCLAHAFLFFKGFHGIQVHRAANWLWRNGQRSLASLLQNRVSEVFGMDIHPAAQLGSHIMIDHATGIVIGETARVGNGCTLLHGVTLGGNGKQQDDRHPKLGVNVLVGAGASILGNVAVGDGAKIGASAVVLSDIPSFATAVGCPAKVIGRVKEQNPASVLDHSCHQVDMFDQFKGQIPYSSVSSRKDAYVFADQRQNVCGVEMPKEEAMPMFFEKKRSASTRLRKQPSEMEARNLQFSVMACV